MHMKTSLAPRLIQIIISVRVVYVYRLLCLLVCVGLKQKVILNDTVTAEWNNYIL